MTVARTTTFAVREILGLDYDGQKDLNGPIATAGSIVDKVVLCRVNKEDPISVSDAELVERWLAAHYYTRTDRLYQSNTTKGSSASFILDREVPEPYKATALELESTGCLAAILKGNRASISWGGKDDPEKLDYDQRNSSGLY